MFTKIENKKTTVGLSCLWWGAFISDNRFYQKKKKKKVTTGEKRRKGFKTTPFSSGDKNANSGTHN